MTFSESILSVLSNYATAKGRASRSEYWWWTLCFVLIMFIVTSLRVNHIISFPLDGLLNLALFLPNLCVAIRRCHDSGHSGWWVICPIVGLIMMLLPSDPHENEYGMPEETLQ